MPIYENGPVRIHYEEAGSGFPLLVIPGGGPDPYRFYGECRQPEENGIASTTP